MSYPEDLQRIKDDFYLIASYLRKMDPDSSNQYSKTSTEENPNSKSEIIASTKSLSAFEEKNWKTLWPQLLAVLILAANNITIGISLGFSAILIPQLDKAFNATISEASWIASVLPLTSPIGSILAGVLMDKTGRICSLKMSLVPGIIGWTLIAASTNIPTLLTGRVIAGLSASISASAAVVYVTEIARKDMRGSFLSIGPGAVSLGTLVAYLKGWLLPWRTTAWLCNLYLLIPFFFLFLLPESSAWLLSKGKVKEAKKSLEWLHKYQPQPEDQLKTFAEMQLAVLMQEDQKRRLESKNNKGVLKEFLKPTGYKPVLIITGIFFFQQFSGIYIFLFYSVTFFQEVGTALNPYVASICLGVIRVLMSVVNAWMMRYYNRRSLLMWSSLGMAVCMLFSGLFTHWIKNGTTTHTWLPVVFLLFYAVTSMIGLLPIPWTMTAELFPLKIRGIAQSISSSIVNLLMFAALQNYFKMEAAFGGSAGLQWFFAAVSLAAAVYFFIFLPETHKKKLSEIEEYFKYNTIYIRQRPATVVRLDSSKRNYDKNEEDNLLNKV